jgi:HK97 family phage major capsid protein
MNAPIYAKDFATADEFLIAVVRAGLNQPHDPRLRWSAAAGANESVPAEGGFLVQQDFALELIEAVEAFSTILRDTNRQPMTRGNVLRLPTFDERSRVAGSRFGGARVYRAGEGLSVPASMPKYKAVNLHLTKLMANSTATGELSDDVPALLTILKRTFAAEAATVADDEIIGGSGASGEMLGVLNSPALITIDPESGQAAQTVRAENAVKAWARCWAPGQRKAVWLYNSELAPQLFALAYNGTPLVTFGTGGPLMMGRPLIAHESCRTPGTVGDLLLVVPDQYVIGERPAEFADSLHLRFVEHEQCFRFIWRIAGQPGWSSALTPMNGTNTVSPFIAIGARQ